MATFSGNAAGYQVHYLADGRIQVVDIDASNGDTGTRIVPSDSGLTFDDRIYQVTTRTETRVNTATVGDQIDTAVAVLADGGHMTVFTSYIVPGSGAFRSLGQRYDAEGNAVGGEVVVGGQAPDRNLLALNIAALNDGGYVVVATGYSLEDSYTNIYAQRYDAMGNEAGGQILVNTFTAGDQVPSETTALADGGFLVTWTSPDQDGAGNGVYAQRFDALGNKAGAEFRVNTTVASDQQYSAVAALADGGFAITWQSWDQDGHSYGVYAQRYDSAGNAVGTETRVNTTTLGHQGNPVITGLAGGGYLIAWNSYESSDYVFRSQRYDAAGNAMGGETRINTTPAKSGGLDVASLAGGGYIVVWASSENDYYGSGANVFAQRYDAAGNKVGGEVRINAMPMLYGAGVDVTTFADGDYLITWTPVLEGGDGADIYSRRFDADGKAISGDRFVMTGTAADDVMNGGLGEQTLFGEGGHDTLNGGAGDDQLHGGSGADTINGGMGQDRLWGGPGNNTLNGGEGNDRLIGRGILNGGVGDDLLFANIRDTVLNGDEGKDRLVGNYGDDTLMGGAGDDRLEGGVEGRDNLNGGGGIDSLFGGSEEDYMHGGSGADRLSGDRGEDVLVGGVGNDVLDGGDESDTLTGGGGADAFMFDESVNPFTEVDTITDFAVSGGDVIQLDNSYYQAFIETGVLHATKFRANAEGRAMDSDDHLVYNTVTGALFYDIDGNRAIAAIQIAVLGVDTHPALTAADILII